jgi:phosphoserine phosphatase
MERLKEGMLALTKGWDRSQIEDLVRDVLFDVIDPCVYQEALDLIALHRSEGRRIYIVSSSPEEVVRTARPAFRRQRRHRHTGPGGRQRPLHGRTRVLRLREQKAEAIPRPRANGWA